MCTFEARASCECGLGQNPAVPPVDDPSVDAQALARCDASGEADAEVDGQSFPVASNDGLGHGLIEDGGDNAAMNGATEALPVFGRNPEGVYSIQGLLEGEAESCRIMRTADHAIGIEWSMRAGGRRNERLGLPRLVS
jgi:hypothetical protein